MVGGMFLSYDLFPFYLHSREVKTIAGKARQTWFQIWLFLLLSVQPWTYSPTSLQTLFTSSRNNNSLSHTVTRKDHLDDVGKALA